MSPEHYLHTCIERGYLWSSARVLLEVYFGDPGQFLIIWNWSSKSAYVGWLIPGADSCLLLAGVSQHFSVLTLTFGSGCQEELLRDFQTGGSGRSFQFVICRCCLNIISRHIWDRRLGRIVSISPLIVNISRAFQIQVVKDLLFVI